jgi:hypothetical protein
MVFQKVDRTKNLRVKVIIKNLHQKLLATEMLTLRRCVQEKLENFAKMMAI